jgi:hypothetical protein
MIFQHDSSPQQPNSLCLDHNTGEIKYSNIDGFVKSPSAALRFNPALLDKNPAHRIQG